MTEETAKNEVKAPAKAKLPTVGTNALAIKWPADPQGANLKLKQGGVSAAKRVNGDKAKLERLIQTLRIIEAHAIERYKVDAAARTVTKQNAVSASKRVAERRAREAEAEAVKLRKQLAETEARRDANAKAAE